MLKDENFPHNIKTKPASNFVLDTLPVFIIAFQTELKFKNGLETCQSNFPHRIYLGLSFLGFLVQTSPLKNWHSSFHKPLDNWKSAIFGKASHQL